jgi:hypothetical protein
MSTAPDIEAQAAVEAPEEVPEAPPEVRPEEFTQGTAKPVGFSAFGSTVEAELMKPLDPKRVRIREKKYEYLAGHDVYRRANEIFGFGNWGTRIVALEMVDAVPVEKNDKKGWHVGYSCTVELWIAGMQGPISGVGYGDGVEYTPGARVRATELAMKEAETDATKRAFTKLGDQFGLILYAKDDEKRRIESDRNEEGSQPIAATRTPMPDFPENWAAIGSRMATVLGAEEADVWIKQAVHHLLGKKTTVEASKAQKDKAFQVMSAATVDVEAIPHDLLLTVDARQIVQETFAKRLAGTVLDGPEWALDPIEVEAGRPVKTPVEGGEADQG